MKRWVSWKTERRCDLRSKLEQAKHAYNVSCRQLVNALLKRMNQLREMTSECDGANSRTLKRRCQVKEYTIHQAQEEKVTIGAL